MVLYTPGHSTALYTVLKVVWKSWGLPLTSYPLCLIPSLSLPCSWRGWAKSWGLIPPPRGSLTLSPGYTYASRGWKTESSVLLTRDNVEDVDSDKNVAEMIKLLLDHRADTTLLTNGHSPLSLAIVSGNDTVGRALFSFPRKRGNMFSPALVCVCVCVCVCVSVCDHDN